jgi:hypothetical protein
LIASLAFCPEDHGIVHDVISMKTDISWGGNQASIPPPPGFLEYIIIEKKKETYQILTQTIDGIF